MTYFIYHQGHQIVGNLLPSPLLVTYEDALVFIKQHAIENTDGFGRQTYDIYESTDLVVVEGGYVLKKVGNKVKVKISTTAEIDND